MASMKERENKRAKNVDNTARNNDKNMNIVQMMIYSPSTSLHPPHTIPHKRKTQEEKGKRKSK